MDRERVYGYDGRNAEVVTKQEFKDECNVNVIVEAYKKGAPLGVTIHDGQFADVSELGDYKTAVDTVLEAEAIFKKLPMTIKSVVKDPAGFVDFVNDPENKDQLVKWGLVPGPEPAAAVETAEVVAETADGT